MSLQTTPPTFPATTRNGDSHTARNLLIVASLLSLALWYIPAANVIAYPIRIFVTLVHEGSHALMTVLTGGHVVGMAIMQNTSGVTLSMGGFQPLIYMAGYIGAVAFGAACLQLGRKAKSGKRGLVLLASIVLIATGLWMRPIGESAFGFWMGLAVGGGLLLASRYLGENAAAFLTSFLSVQLCLNALFDLRDLVWLTTNTKVPNDAVFMARDYGLFPWFWALLWAGCSLLILGVALRAYWRGSKSGER